MYSRFCCASLCVQDILMVVFCNRIHSMVVNPKGYSSNKVRCTKTLESIDEKATVCSTYTAFGRIIILNNKYVSFLITRVFTFCNHEYKCWCYSSSSSSSPL